MNRIFADSMKMKVGKCLSLFVFFVEKINLRIVSTDAIAVCPHHRSLTFCCYGFDWFLSMLCLTTSSPRPVTSYPDLEWQENGELLVLCEVLDVPFVPNNRKIFERNNLWSRSTLNINVTLHCTIYTELTRADLYWLFISNPTQLFQ